MRNFYFKKKYMCYDMLNLKVKEKIVAHAYYGSYNYKQTKLEKY